MSTISPSTRTRTKPCRRAPSKTRSPSVLRSLISGARTSRRVPSGSARTWSTICWTRLALDRVAVRAVRDADPREEQPQVVVDLGDRADRGARVARGALLVDRDGRRQPVDLVDVRLLHLAEELAGVGAQALDVAPLALRVDRVEGEAGLARARQAGDDDQPVARERDVDVLEVVLARSANDELVLGHVGSLADSEGIEQMFLTPSSPARPDGSGRIPGVARSCHVLARWTLGGVRSQGPRPARMIIRPSGRLSVAMQAAWIVMQAPEPRTQKRPPKAHVVHLWQEHEARASASGTDVGVSTTATQPFRRRARGPPGRGSAPPSPGTRRARAGPVHDVRRDRSIPGRAVEPASLPARCRPRARRGSRAASRRPCPSSMPGTPSTPSRPAGSSSAGRTVDAGDLHRLTGRGGGGATPAARTVGSAGQSRACPRLARRRARPRDRR